MNQTFVEPVLGIWRSISLFLVLALVVNPTSADVLAGAKSISLDLDFKADRPPNGQMDNLLPTANGLTQFRRNLEGTFTSLDQAVPLQNSTPFLSIALVANVLNYNSSLVHFKVRFSNDGILWTAWDELDMFHEKDPAESRFISEMLILPKETKYFTYSITFERATAGALPIWVEDLRFDFFSPGEGSGANPGVFKTDPGEEQCACPLPEFATRTDWDCPDGQNASCSDATIIPTTHMIVHHSAGSNSSNNWPAVVLAIFNLHVNTNGWCDIGYNWLIDPNGNIYEGRGGGNNVRGAHFCGTNSGTMGVCMMGTYSNVPPTDTAIASLKKLIAWKSCDSQLDILSSEPHTSSGLNLNIVSGHRNGCSTLCPGDSLFYLLPTIRTDAQGIVDTCITIASGIDADLFPAENVQLYPNPTTNAFTLSVEIAEVWDGKLRLLNQMGQVVLEEEIILYPGLNQRKLDLKDQTAGLYHLQLSNAASQTSQKVYLLR
ncbi:MAG: N-acetylmuramoyl-L-alanine amidase [Bacteroidia bacterium]